MSEAKQSDLLTLDEAVTALPRRVHRQTIWGWARKGLRARNGMRIHLRHLRLGRQILTTREWLDDFLHAVVAADLAVHGQPPQERAHQVSP